MRPADTFDLKKFITEGKLLKEQTKPKEYLLLIWHTREDYPSENLLMAFTSDNLDELEQMGKGELADEIEKVLNIEIDPSDFEDEVISFSDFMDEYGNEKNPNKITLDPSKTFEI
jgi:hypothetical protein